MDTVSRVLFCFIALKFWLNFTIFLYIFELTVTVLLFSGHWLFIIVMLVIISLYLLKRSCPTNNANILTLCELSVVFFSLGIGGLQIYRGNSYCHWWRNFSFTYMFKYGIFFLPLVELLLMDFAHRQNLRRWKHCPKWLKYVKYAKHSIQNWFNKNISHICIF